MLPLLLRLLNGKMTFQRDCEFVISLEATFQGYSLLSHHAITCGDLCGRDAL